jgi:hypothetical protein
MLPFECLQTLQGLWCSNGEQATIRSPVREMLVPGGQTILNKTQQRVPSYRYAPLLQRRNNWYLRISFSSLKRQQASIHIETRQDLSGPLPIQKYDGGQLEYQRQHHQCYQSSDHASQSSHEIHYSSLSSLPLCRP